MKAIKAKTKLDPWKARHSDAEYELGIVMAFFVGLEQARFPSREQDRVIFRCKKAIEGAQSCLRFAAECREFEVQP